LLSLGTVLNVQSNSLPESLSAFMPDELGPIVETRLDTTQRSSRGI
jgi:hypothetical protein